MAISNKRDAARLRTALFTSAALASLVIAGAAQAQTVATPNPQVTGPSITTVVDTPQTLTIPVVPVVETPAITINNTLTPSQIFDPANVTGIGQFVLDAGGGSVGLCTATLINPRMVIYAAHCVNNAAATSYGANSGGTAVAVGFETNTRANGPGQSDELLNWLLGGSTGPGQYRTNTAQSLYNLNQVFWNPASRAAASCTNASSCFLEGDIATGVLDTPAGNVPTWALLFSPLATPASINPATGTGYHVTIEGYGRNGNGTTGAVGNDFRRRVAENMLGALTSISERNLFLFGTTGAPSRPQLLYWLDFDDPTRTSPFDFNGFRDNALPREGLTGPGDSGGPLILDQRFARSVILGVLSGGSTFFTGQAGGSYGTQSFYQPLFLYWDWIVANNPYHYVTASAGNRNWEDPTAWLTELDPNYQIINAAGQLVNGVPTNLGGTNIVTTPNFGEFCFQDPTTNTCQNTNGTIRNNVPNNPSGVAPVIGITADETGTPDMVNLTTGGTAAGGPDGAGQPTAADPGYAVTVTPAPTLLNGLPGASNFVPNNADGVRTTGTIGRYFDVTLRNAGTVSLNSTVTVDRFSMVGAQSQLTVNAGASLTSLLAINQLTGIVQTNGIINSGGDYLFMSGLLTGTGRINAPFLTSVLGNFAPGTLTSIGTLTIGGNLVMASGSTYLVNLGPNGTSDRLVVVANGTSIGQANVGGLVSFTPDASTRFGDVFTILTAAGGVTGTFSGTSLSAILKPTFIYTNPNAVQVRIDANPYVSVVSGASPVQVAYARLLDANRGNTATGASGLYGQLDLQNAATIQATLDSWAPRTETLRTSLGTVASDNMARFYRDRVGQIGAGGDTGGTVAVIGQPLAVVGSLNNVGAMGTMTLDPATPQMSVTRGKVPDDVSVFFAGGYLDGDSAPMPTAIPLGGRDQFDGWYGAAGIEKQVSSMLTLGLGLSYTNVRGTTTVGQSAKGELYQGTLYGKLAWPNGVTIDGVFSAGLFDTRTSRSASLLATPYTLKSNDQAIALSGEVGIAKMFDIGSLQVGPRVAIRRSGAGFSDTLETGGPMALRIDRDGKQSTQARAGLMLGGGTGKFRPYLNGYYVHDFENEPAVFGANFVGGIGPNAQFALAGLDKDWFEISGGIGIDTGAITLSIGADTTIGRTDVTNQSYRGSIKFHF